MLGSPCKILLLSTSKAHLLLGTTIGNFLFSALRKMLGQNIFEINRNDENEKKKKEKIIRIGLQLFMQIISRL